MSGTNGGNGVSRLMMSHEAFKKLGVSAADASASMAHAFKQANGAAKTFTNAHGLPLEVSELVPPGEVWAIDEASINDLGMATAYTQGTVRLANGETLTINSGTVQLDDEGKANVTLGLDPVESMDTTLFERVIEEARVATGVETHPPEDLLAEMRAKAESLGIELRLQRKLNGLRMDWTIVAHTNRGDVTSTVVPPVGAPASWDAQDIADAWRDAFAGLGLL